MKKIVLSAIAAFCMINVNAQNAYGIKPVHATAGSTVTTDIVLVNDFDCYQHQIEILLPKGVTVVKNSRGKFAIGSSITVLSGEGERCEYAFKAQNSGAASMKGDQEYIKFSGYGDDYVEPGDGAVARLHLVVDASVAPGVYPIYTFNTKAGALSYDDAGFKGADGTSYIVVGEPTEGELVVQNHFDAFVNAELVKETAITRVNLTAATAIPEFTYVDSREVVAPADVTTSVKYVGDKANYYSVNVPFDAAISGTGKVYEFKSAANGWATFEPATSVEANKTYLAEGAVTLTAASAKVAPVQNETGQSGSYVKDGTFYHGTGLTVPATRGLFNVPSGSNLRVVVDGVVTNITTAQIESGEVSYDLQGRQTTNAKNGVFVVNGKKQFVK